jgi:hypothetical protein
MEMGIGPSMMKPIVTGDIAQNIRDIEENRMAL